MSLLDDYLENSEIFKGQENRLDKEAFDKLVEEHGVDVAKGYLKAVAEMTDVVAHLMIDTITVDGTAFEALGTRDSVCGKVKNLHKALLGFIEANGISTEGMEKPRWWRTRQPGF